MSRSNLNIVPTPLNPRQRLDVLKLRFQEIQSEAEDLILQIQEIRKLKLDDKTKQALAKLQRKVRNSDVLKLYAGEDFNPEWITLSLVESLEDDLKKFRFSVGKILNEEDGENAEDTEDISVPNIPESRPCTASIIQFHYQEISPSAR